MIPVTLRLLPPGPVSQAVRVDARIAAPAGKTVRLLIDGVCVGETTLQSVGKWRFAVIPFSCGKLTGEHRIQAVIADENGGECGKADRNLTVVPASGISAGVLSGAWCGFYHWSETEGRLWNKELKNFTSGDWRRTVRDMHAIGMNIIVVQELFRSAARYDDKPYFPDGYQGIAYYPSALTDKRVEIACSDPLEAVMSEADALGMAVFPGIGLYAWFDYGKESLAWHEKIAREVWKRYGHHQSFYGWYVSDEIFGDLDYTPTSAQEAIDFFHSFAALRDELNPALPVMLAPNCFYLEKVVEKWKRLARELDILCPFGFGRPRPPGDVPVEQCLAYLREIAQASGVHLWMDMEAFTFAPDKALLPRPAESLFAELDHFNLFETALCYQYPGLFCAPDSPVKPGGEAAVRAYTEYQKIFQQRTECK